MEFRLDILGSFPAPSGVAESCPTPISRMRNLRLGNSHFLLPQPQLCTRRRSGAAGGAPNSSPPGSRHEVTTTPRTGQAGLPPKACGPDLAPRPQSCDRGGNSPPFGEGAWKASSGSAACAPAHVVPTDPSLFPLPPKKERFRSTPIISFYFSDLVHKTSSL